MGKNQSCFFDSSMAVYYAINRILQNSDDITRSGALSAGGICNSLPISCHVTEAEPDMARVGL